MEIGRSLRAVEPASEQANLLRRRHFKILDHTLDSGQGPLPFTETVADELHQWIAAYAEDQLTFAHWVIMPNHLHLLTKPIALEGNKEFQTVWRRFKGRSSRFLNRLLESSGALWQDSLYDRWVRNETEWNRWIDYFRKNPVKARLVARPEDYPYLR